MSGMHLFVTAPFMWYDCCGYDPQSNRCVNAWIENDVLTPHTPHPCVKVCIGCQPQQPLTIAGLASHEPITVYAPEGFVVADGRRQAPGVWQVDTPDGHLLIEPTVC